MLLRSCGLLLTALTLLNAQSAAGLKWTVPTGWKTESAARPMRAATYTVDGAECGVYFFGQGQGGSVEANLERWKNQFGSSVAKTAKRTIHGVPVTTIDVSGNYTGMGGPMSQEKTSMPGYRLLGAIVEGPGGNIFFKFTGPEKIIAANQAKFELLLNSVTK
jgi:hypothetical protein